MRLTPPGTVIFILSMLLALVTLLSAFGSANIPWVSAHEFLAMTIAWGLLTIGVLFRGV